VLRVSCSGERIESRPLEKKAGLADKPVVSNKLHPFAE
jgi:hypothetical protein